MKSKNILILALILASIFLISAISANENISDTDVLSVNETNDEVEQTNDDEQTDDSEETLAEDSNTDEVTTSSGPQGEVTVTQKISKSKVKVGDDVKITIIIKNTGSTTLDLVRVTPTKTAGLAFKTYEGYSWNQEPDSFIYADELQPGESITLYLTYAAKKTGTLNFDYVVTSNDTADLENTISIDVSDSASHHPVHKTNHTRVVDTRNTGNPIFLLLLAVFAVIPIRKLR